MKTPQNPTSGSWDGLPDVGPGASVPGQDHPFGGGPVPLDFHGVIVEGPRWARRLSAIAGLLAPLGRLIDRLFVAAVWGGLTLVGAATVTGQLHRLGLSDTPVAGYKPIHLVLAGIAVVLLTAITADVFAFGVRNKRARADLVRQITGLPGRPIQLLDHPTTAPAVCLPDDPDLADPNGLTGTGTPAAGVVASRDAA
jgi:hypothetical protein